MDTSNIIVVVGPASSEHIASSLRVSCPHHSVWFLDVDDGTTRPPVQGDCGQACKHLEHFVVLRIEDDPSSTNLMVFYSATAPNGNGPAGASVQHTHEQCVSASVVILMPPHGTPAQAPLGLTRAAPGAHPTLEHYPFLAPKLVALVAQGGVPEAGSTAKQQQQAWLCPPLYRGIVPPALPNLLFLQPEPPQGLAVAAGGAKNRSRQVRWVVALLHDFLQLPPTAEMAESAAADLHAHLQVQQQQQQLEAGPNGKEAPRVAPLWACCFRPAARSESSPRRPAPPPLPLPPARDRLSLDLAEVAAQVTEGPGEQLKPQPQRQACAPLSLPPQQQASPSHQHQRHSPQCQASSTLLQHSHSQQQLQQQLLQQRPLSSQQQQQQQARPASGRGGSRQAPGSHPSSGQYNGSAGDNSPSRSRLLAIIAPTAASSGLVLSPLLRAASPSGGAAAAAALLAKQGSGSLLWTSTSVSLPTNNNNQQQQHSTADSQQLQQQGVLRTVPDSAVLNAQSRAGMAGQQQQQQCAQAGGSRSGGGAAAVAAAGSGVASGAHCTTTGASGLTHSALAERTISSNSLLLGSRETEQGALQGGTLTSQDYSRVPRLLHGNTSSYSRSAAVAAAEMFLKEAAMQRSQMLSSTNDRLLAVGERGSAAEASPTGRGPLLQAAGSAMLMNTAPLALVSTRDSNRTDSGSLSHVVGHPPTAPLAPPVMSLAVAAQDEGGAGDCTATATTCSAPAVPPQRSSAPPDCATSDRSSSSGCSDAPAVAAASGPGPEHACAPVGNMQEPLAPLDRDTPNRPASLVMTTLANNAFVAASHDSHASAAVPAPPRLARSSLHFGSIEPSSLPDGPTGLFRPGSLIGTDTISRELASLRLALRQTSTIMGTSPCLPSAGTPMAGAGGPPPFASIRSTSTLGRARDDTLAALIHVGDGGHGADVDRYEAELLESAGHISTGSEREDGEGGTSTWCAAAAAGADVSRPSARQLQQQQQAAEGKTALPANLCDRYAQFTVSSPGFAIGMLDVQDALLLSRLQQRSPPPQADAGAGMGDGGTGSGGLAGMMLGAGSQYLSSAQQAPPRQLSRAARSIGRSERGAPPDDGAFATTGGHAAAAKHSSVRRSTSGPFPPLPPLSPLVGRACAPVPPASLAPYALGVLFESRRRSVSSSGPPPFEFSQQLLQGQPSPGPSPPPTALSPAASSARLQPPSASSSSTQVLPLELQQQLQPPQQQQYYGGEDGAAAGVGNGGLAPRPHHVPSRLSRTFAEALKRGSSGFLPAYADNHMPAPVVPRTAPLPSGSGAFAAPGMGMAVDAPAPGALPRSASTYGATSRFGRVSAGPTPGASGPDASGGLTTHTHDATQFSNQRTSMHSGNMPLGSGGGVSDPRVGDAILSWDRTLRLLGSQVAESGSLGGSGSRPQVGSSATRLRGLLRGSTWSKAMFGARVHGATSASGVQPRTWVAPHSPSPRAARNQSSAGLPGVPSPSPLPPACPPPRASTSAAAVVPLGTAAASPGGLPPPSRQCGSSMHGAGDAEVALARWRTSAQSSRTSIALCEPQLLATAYDASALQHTASSSSASGLQGHLPGPAAAAAGGEDLQAANISSSARIGLHLQSPTPQGGTTLASRGPHTQAQAPSSPDTGTLTGGTGTQVYTGTGPLPSGMILGRGSFEGARGSSSRRLYAAAAADSAGGGWERLTPPPPAASEDQQHFVGSAAGLGSGALKGVVVHPAQQQRPIRRAASWAGAAALEHMGSTGHPACVRGSAMAVVPLSEETHSEELLQLVINVAAAGPAANQRPSSAAPAPSASTPGSAYKDSPYAPSASSGSRRMTGGGNLQGREGGPGGQGLGAQVAGLVSWGVHFVTGRSRGSRGT